MELDLHTIGLGAKVRSRRKIKPYRVVVKFERSGVEAMTVLTVRTNGWSRAVRCARLKIERAGMRVLSAQLYEKAFREAAVRRLPADQSPPESRPKAKPVAKGGGGARSARTGAKRGKAVEDLRRALERAAAALSKLSERINDC